MWRHSSLLPNILHPRCRPDVRLPLSACLHAFLDGMILTIYCSMLVSRGVSVTQQTVRSALTITAPISSACIRTTMRTAPRTCASRPPAAAVTICLPRRMHAPAEHLLTKWGIVPAHSAWRTLLRSRSRASFRQARYYPSMRRTLFVRLSLTYSLSPPSRIPAPPRRAYSFVPDTTHENIRRIRPSTSLRVDACARACVAPRAVYERHI